MDTWLKVAIGAVLYATWVWLVLSMRADVEPLVQATQAALVGLGMYHMNGRGDGK